MRYVEPRYVTTFVNETDDAWRIDYNDGKMLFVVPPGESRKLESWNEKPDWSRFEKVVRKKDGRLVVTENPSWVCPFKGPTLELLNEDGAPEESIAGMNCPVAGPQGYVTAVRGIPKLVPLDIWDPLVKAKAVIWYRKEVRVPIEGTRYFKTETQVVKEYIPRPKGELREILKKRQAIKAEEMKEATEKEMLAQEEMLLGEGA